MYHLIAQTVLSLLILNLCNPTPTNSKTEALFKYRQELFRTNINKESPRKAIEWKNYALFFAVNDYPKSSGYAPLRYPISDADTIANLLEDHYNFETEVFRNPTASDIYNILASYKDKFSKKEIDPNSQLLIYFTGHGDTIIGNGFFIPYAENYDQIHCTGNAYSLIRPLIDRIPCKHIKVVLDVCYGGTFDPKYSFKSSSGFSRPGELSPRDHLLLTHPKYTTRILLASSYDEPVPDKSEFAYQFYKKLKAIDYDDGITTSTELFAHLKNNKCMPYDGYFGNNHPNSSFLFVDNRWKAFQEIICHLPLRKNQIILKKGTTEIQIEDLGEENYRFKIPTHYLKESFQLITSKNQKEKRIYDIEIEEETEFCTLLQDIIKN